MRDSRGEAMRWLRPAENDLQFAGLAVREGYYAQAAPPGQLDQDYVATRYPNGLPGGLPFEAFSLEQAEQAAAEAERFVDLARQRLSEPT